MHGTPNAIYRSAKDQGMPSERAQARPSRAGRKKVGSKQATQAKEAGTSMKTAWPAIIQSTTR